MTTSKYTFEDALEFITHGDFYIVDYKNMVYIFSQEHFGDEEMDCGIYGAIALSEAESGKDICLADAVPDYFINTLIDEVIACFPICSMVDTITYENVRKELEKQSIAEWYKVLNSYSAYRDVDDFIEISKLYAGQLDFKHMSVDGAKEGEIVIIESLMKIKREI